MTIFDAPVEARADPRAIDIFAGLAAVVIMGRYWIRAFSALVSVIIAIPAGAWARRAGYAGLSSADGTAVTDGLCEDEAIVDDRGGEIVSIMTAVPAIAATGTVIPTILLRKELPGLLLAAFEGSDGVGEVVNFKIGRLSPSYRSDMHGDEEVADFTHRRVRVDFDCREGFGDVGVYIAGTASRGSRVLPRQ